jgi:transposase
MRYELTDHEWAAIKPMLPNKPRGVPRVNDRRVLNGIFWVLRSGAPWRDLPDDFGPYTTCYNRFIRWQRTGVWGRIMNALASAHDASVQMIDTSIVRVHQHGACIIRNRRQSMGRSRGGLTSKIHALVDTNGLPVRLGLTAGEAHDNRLADKLLSRLKSGSMLLADRRDLVWINVTANPTAEWIARQLTEAFPWDGAPRYLLRDRDRLYGAVVIRRMRAMGIRDRPIAAASPWQNGFAERLIGSIRRECVDHLVVLGEAHLRRILRSYADYYNGIRTHRSLNKDAPVSRSVQRTGTINSRPILGGLHHQYVRV